MADIVEENKTQSFPEKEVSEKTDKQARKEEQNTENGKECKNGDDKDNESDLDNSTTPPSDNGTDDENEDSSEYDDSSDNAPLKRKSDGPAGDAPDSAVSPKKKAKLEEKDSENGDEETVA